MEMVMKKFVLVLVVLGVVAAIVYLMRNEGGRARLDDLVSRARRSSDASGVEPEIDLREPASEATEPAADDIESAITPN
jgi:hypothetical protein